MKLCKDCKHMIPIFGGSIPRCGHPKAQRNPINGIWDSPCYFERSTNGKCGLDAKRFEEKKPAAEPAPDAGSIIWTQPEPDIKRGWFARLFGW